ncbi:centrosomal protein of 192 kDa isoform X2 [Polypterus senegalus]|uniref:centrosomal protein of 192 kDa isoform X2 n=1 Tax=Polypterus senegalus TaxID=55291 RepID=UPI001964BBA5|nr:centrosomal protein of 192 kDa isoform X2 [Polypterus senegalus]
MESYEDIEDEPFPSYYSYSEDSEVTDMFKPVATLEPFPDYLLARDEREFENGGDDDGAITARSIYDLLLGVQEQVEDEEEGEEQVEDEEEDISPRADTPVNHYSQSSLPFLVHEHKEANVCGTNALPSRTKELDALMDTMGNMDVTGNSKSAFEKWTTAEQLNDSSLKGGFQQNATFEAKNGSWDNELAYYHSFDNEMEAHLFNNTADQFDSEEFLSAGNFKEQLIEDQKEFEREHRFIQEEKMEDLHTSQFGDTSWRLPNPSYINLRASQASSDFDKSCFETSLGHFFSKKSEPLGLLGDYEDVKRPSFGYHIKSPEKRKPVALISPKCQDPDDTKLSAYAASELRTEDLMDQDEDKEMHPLNVAEYDLSDKDASKLELQLSSKIKDLTNSIKSTGGNDIFSLSTIGHAIADASVSSDPVDLAKMILNLYKKKQGRLLSNEEHCEPAIDGDHSEILEYLQKTGEVSKFDFEKYLKFSECALKDSSSVSAYTFDTFHSINLPVTPKIMPDSQQDASTLKKQNSTMCNFDLDDIQRDCFANEESSNSDKGYLSGGLSAEAKGNCPDLSYLQSQIPVSSTREFFPPPPSVNINVTSVISTKPTCLQSLLQKDFSSRGSVEGINKTEQASRHLEREQMFTSVRPNHSHGSSIGSSLSNHSKEEDLLPSQPSVGNMEATADALSVIQKRKESNQCSESRHVIATDENSAGENCANQKRSDLGKPLSPEENQGYEESLFSFRPSTSPLSQSSPSQVLGTGASSTSDNCAASLKRDICKNTSYPSNYSDMSLSRMTYISDSDTTLQNSLDSTKSDNTFQLSTTIVRASPTAAVEQNLGCSKDYYKTLEKSGSSSESMDKPKGGCVERQQVDEYKNYDKTIESTSAALATVSAENNQLCSRNNDPKLGQGNYDSLNRNKKVEHQKDVPRLDTEIDYRKCLPASEGSDSRFNQFMCPKSQIAGAEGHNSVPGFLVNNANSAAHQYLQNMLLTSKAPLAIEASVPLYNVPPVLPNDGVPLGLVNMPQVCSFHPCVTDINNLRPMNINNTDHIERFGINARTGLGILNDNIIVPDEVNFPSDCCVGIASQTSFSVYNPTDFWLNVNTVISSVSINGKKIDFFPCQWLSVRKINVIGPRTTEEQKVLFIPPQPGVYKCELSISSCPVCADKEVAAQAQVLAKKVLMLAKAEYPNLEVDLGMSEMIEFGDVVNGTLKVLPLKLINHSCMQFPIRLVIDATAAAWRCFTFSTKSGEMTTTTANPVEKNSNLAAPSVINLVMHSSTGNKEADSFVASVQFCAPQKTVSASGDLGPADEYTARIDIELDSPGSSYVIKSIPLHARAGVARVHAPKDLQNLHLSAPFGTRAQQVLPLKNAGNIAVHLSLKISGSKDCFSVEPEYLSLLPGDEKKAVISFFCNCSDGIKESIVTILVLPNGPQYEVFAKGEMSNSVKNPLPGMPPDEQGNVEVPRILSNKMFVAWEGVALGEALQKKLVLRNNCDSGVQQLRLLIRGQDRDCFKIQSTVGEEKMLSSIQDLTIGPKEDAPIYLLLTPTRVACMHAILDIKHSKMRVSQPGIKFTIPLSGYGGRSHIILEGVQKLYDSYAITVNDDTSKDMMKVDFRIRNVGSRAAYVKAIPFVDVQRKALMDHKVMHVIPKEFVLKENAHEVVSLVFNKKRGKLLCETKRSVLCTVCFFSGDEISRQHYRRCLSNKNQTHKTAIPLNTLKNVEFDVKFRGEENISEECDLPVRPSDVQLFFGSMSKTMLAVFENLELKNCGGTLHQSCSNRDTEQDSDHQNSNEFIGNSSLDMLPVKGPQGEPLALNIPEKMSRPSSAIKDSWSVQPEQLVLNNSSIIGGRITIVNHSLRDLNFELSWPAHCLTINPQHGNIEPEGQLQIRVSSCLSGTSRPLQLPWSGNIHIQCDGQQKSVKVQIRESPASEGSVSLSSQTTQNLFPAVSDTSAMQMSKPLQKSPSTKVKVRNESLTFPVTSSGASSASVLEIENPDEKEITWYISSLAPAYVKGVDNKGEVYRANYSAFNWSHLSGTLEPLGKTEVVVKFVPQAKGNYVQFWHLVCCPVNESHKNHKIQIQLSGQSKHEETASACKTTKKSLPAAKTESAVKTKKITFEASTKNVSLEMKKQKGVLAPVEVYTFPCTRVGHSSSVKVNLMNASSSDHMLKFKLPKGPFRIKLSEYLLCVRRYLHLPVQFHPRSPGMYEEVLHIESDTCRNIQIKLTGECCV